MNISFVAGEGAPLDQVQLYNRWEGLRDGSPGAPDLTDAIQDRWEEPIESADVPVLTDDYAPTDSLLLG